MKRMQQRRAEFSIGVTYDTPRAKVAAIPGMIRQIVEAQPKVRLDRTHFKSFGDSALLFETIYFVLEPEFNLYMDTQQNINLQLMERFEAEGIEFAFPTRTLYLKREDSQRDSAA